MYPDLKSIDSLTDFNVTLSNLKAINSSKAVINDLTLNMDQDCDEIKYQMKTFFSKQRQLKSLGINRFPGDPLWFYRLMSRFCLNLTRIEIQMLKEYHEDTADLTDCLCSMKKLKTIIIDIKHEGFHEDQIILILDTLKDLNDFRYWPVTQDDDTFYEMRDMFHQTMREYSGYSIYSTPKIQDFD